EGARARGQRRPLPPDARPAGAGGRKRRDGDARAPGPQPHRRSGAPASLLTAGQRLDAVRTGPPGSAAPFSCPSAPRGCPRGADAQDSCDSWVSPCFVGAVLRVIRAPGGKGRMDQTEQAVEGRAEAAVSAGAPRTGVRARFALQALGYRIPALANRLPYMLGGLTFLGLVV